MKTNNKIRSLEQALKTIQAAQKWIPGLVKAMRVSGQFGIKFPTDLEFDLPRSIPHLKDRIKEQYKTVEILNKNKEILKSGKIYEIQFKNSVDGKAMYLVKIVRFNTDSVKVKLLVSDTETSFELIPISKRYNGWYYCPFILSEVRKITEVSVKDLVLYAGQNCTEHFEKIIKGE